MLGPYRCWTQEHHPQALHHTLPSRGLAASGVTANQSDPLRPWGPGANAPVPSATFWAQAPGTVWLQPPFPGLCSLPLLLPLPRRPQSQLPFMCSHSLWNCQVCGNSRPACVIDLWRLFPLPDSSQPGPGGHHSVWGLAPSHVSAETLLRGPHLSPLLWALPALSSSPTDMHSQPCTSSCCPQLAPNGLLICPFKSCTSS